MPGVSGPTENEVLHALESLYIDLDGRSPFSDDALYEEVACTLAEEVDHTQGFRYNPDESGDMTSALVDLLKLRGFQGDVTSRSQVLDFLASEAQMTRLAAHLSLSKEENAETDAEHSKEGQSSRSPEHRDDDDENVASSISRICRSLGVQLENACEIQQPADLVRIVDDLAAKVTERFSVAKPLGEPLFDSETAERIMRTTSEECSSICDALNQEHALRKGLLMRRLEVTIQSFGYSDRAADDGFESVRRAALRAVKSSEQSTSVFDALVARDWLLDVDRVGTASSEGSGKESEVKRVLMGSVPDRGGRIGSAKGKPGMPEFAPRSTASGSQHTHRKGKHRGKGQGRSHKK